MVSLSKNRLAAPLIINPISGRGQKGDRRLVIAAARNLGWNGPILETDPKNGASALAKIAVNGGALHILVAGGDGTVRQVLSEVVNKNITLGIIPLGTGNVFSKNLGIPQDIRQSVEVSLLGSPRKVDVGRANGHYFVLIAGMGLDAQMMGKTTSKEKHRFGVFAYLLTGLRLLSRPNRHYRLVLNGSRHLNLRAKSILVANIGKTEGGLEVVPGAQPRTGNLKIGIIKSDNIFSFIRLFAKALEGHLTRDPDYQLFEGRLVEIFPVPKPQAFECDGDRFPSTRRLLIEIIPHSASILVPKTPV